MKILYVDDEPDIREVAELCLQLDPSLMVRTCESGKQAIEVAASWQPDAILLDVMMPRMDGPMTRSALLAAPETVSLQ